jgi:dipeptidyl aminopeptidase/acylaminoacyl peptidase
LKFLYLILALVILLPLLNLILSIHPPKFKTPDDPKQYGLAYETVSFPTEDGLMLQGWFIPAESTSRKKPPQEKETRESCATILFGHGYPFDKANILRHALFLHARFNLLLFDFRYFGESDGAYTTAGILETRDVTAAVKYLKSREDVDPTRIGAMGFSLSASSFILARNQDLKAIVADSAYASLEKVVQRQFFFLPGPSKWPFVFLTKVYARLLLGVQLSDAVPADVVGELKIPLLLIHGDADSQIPVEHSHDIHVKANPETTELWIVQGADHGFAHALKGYEYEIRVREFFERHLCPETSPSLRR